MTTSKALGEPDVSTTQVIAAGVFPVDGVPQVVELLARDRSYWLRVADGAERPLSRDAAKTIIDIIGDPDAAIRKEVP